MEAVTGKYKVASVRFIDGACVVNKTKIYSFALFDDSIGIGDTVLCDTVNGMLVGVVVDIDYNETSNNKPTKEIVCKVDFTDFIKRKELREKKKELKKQMDKMVKDSQELFLYQTIAEKNPDMAILLEAYLKLADV